MVENFMEELLNGLQMSRVNAEYDFQLMDVVKRNDKHMKTLLVKRKGDVISVTFYRDDLLRRFREAEYDMDVLIENIIELLKNKVLDTDFTERLVQRTVRLKDYDSVKDNIVFRLVNLHSNEDYLKNLIYVPFLDLAVCFYIVVEEGNEVGAIQLNRNIFNFWNVTLDEVYQKAMENTPVLMPYHFKSMAEIFEKAIDTGNFGQYMNPPDYVDSNIWVLGNEKQIFGASVILYDGIMGEIAKIMNVDDVIILLSSVHESIILPFSKDYSIDYLRDLVSYVNDTQIEAEDWLSYSVYRYSLERDEISILTE